MPKQPMDDLNKPAAATKAARDAGDLLRDGLSGDLLPDSVAQAAGRLNIGSRLTAETVSPVDYVSPMRSVLDEIGGARGRSTAPAPSGPVASPTIHHAREGAPPPSLSAPGPISSPPVTVAEIGARVRAARKAMGMTQQRFADLAGVGRRFLIELEHGKSSLEIGRVLAVCHAAGIKLGFTA